jgi:hypothetical protein
VVVGSWQVASCRSYLCNTWKAVLTLHPPLRPLSHNVNPRDGAQDMVYCSEIRGVLAQKCCRMPLGSLDYLKEATPQGRGISRPQKYHF